jgi:lipopolysaccharide assembly outer membrane protein LptD (OstA)
LFIVAVILVLIAVPASAQLIPGWETKQFTFERIDAERIRLMREVEVIGTGQNAGQQIFADGLEWNTVTGEFSAVGNVVLASATARLSADRVVFNTKTGLGTFYTASGLASLGDRAAEAKSMFGTLEPDIYFYGEIIEKIGDDKYRIYKGGFTTCVQPTPRWEIVTGQATINLEDYAILRNAVVRVKDVPVFYLPVLYYPIQSDDRATGFLLPTYGTSTYRGQSLSNAFFWAMNRSQDMTLFHDWFTKTGQGVGTEYRYAAAPGSEGQLRAYWLSQKEASFEVPGGGQTTTPAGKSHEITGGVAQMLPLGLRARGRIDYFSSLTTQQLYNTNIYEASRRQRTFGGSVTGAWGGVNVTSNFQRSELFSSETDSIVNGYAPSVNVNLSSKRLGTLPFYVAVNSETSNVLYLDRRLGIERDLGLQKFDATPSVRAALTNWPFLNLNATVAYRHTYYSESLNENQVQVPVPLTRRYFDLRADVLGPVFSRVFTPNNALADRLKHVIEPNLNVQRITDFDNLNGVVTATSSYDYVIGGVTRVNYGLTNRILVRKASTAPGAPAAGAPRELLNVAVTQTYYTDPTASRYDTSYQSSFQQVTRPPSSFSPVAVTLRAAPTLLSTATVRVEYDHEDSLVRSFSATGNSNYRAAQVSLGWSTRKYTDTLRENALNAASTLSFLDGKTGGTYILNWDIGRGYVIQQRWVGFYNAQCCGIALEYQEFNFPSDPRFPIPKDRRFNMSFTLAGIGTFSNFFGAFTGGRY